MSGLILGLDSETCLIRPGRMAPPLVCVSLALGEDVDLVHRAEARDHVVAAFESDAILCGHNLAYDMSVFCAEWPEILPLVFEVYAADRISDTEIREKLLHIAKGTYRRFEREDGEWVKLGYSLAEVAKRHLHIEMPKEDTWRLRYEELIDMPITFWPKDAREYAMTDAIVPPLVREKQDCMIVPPLDERGSKFLKDEYRQTRAALWLRFMECWGMPINVEGVRAFAQKTQQKFTTIMEELVEAGLARRKQNSLLSRKERSVQRAQQRLAKVAQELEDMRSFVEGGAPAKLVGRAEKKLSTASSAFRLALETFAAVQEETKDEPPVYSRNESGARARMAAVFAGCERTPHRQAKIDDDNCQRSGDALMKKYGDASSLMKTLSTDVPLLLGVSKTNLKRGWVTKEERIERQRALFAGEPIRHDRIFSSFEVLKETGRTGSSDNVQNFPTEQGMRECVEAPPGKVFAIADYSGMELRTWSQCCRIMCGTSKMAEALNKGLDPHLMIACRIVGCSYEEAKADYKQNPKGRIYYPRQSSKVVNFGRPGGLGKARLVDYARKSYGVILTEDPVPESDVMSAHELIEYWHATWPEGRRWFDVLGQITDDLYPRVKQFFSHRYRGDVSFCDGANSFFQGLAADAAKNAGFLIARACYAEPESPLYGWRMVNFIHDEFALEGPDDENAHDAAMELSRLMVEGAAPFLPDVPAVVEPLLCRRWSKAAKPLFDHNGRLVPWDFGVEDSMKEAAE